MASIHAALELIKHDPLGVLCRRSIERACRDAGHSWRDRELDPTVTLALFVQQIAHGNAPCAEVCHVGHWIREISTELRRPPLVVTSVRTRGEHGVF